MSTEASSSRVPTIDEVQEIVQETLDEKLTNGDISELKVGRNTVRLLSNNIELSGDIETTGSTTIWDGADGRIGTDLVDGVSIDEASTIVWSSLQTFNAGIDMGGDIDMGSNNTVVNLPSPSDPSDAATKNYADSIEQGLEIKDSVVVATESNINLGSSANPNPVDGVNLTDGDRLLLKEQSDATENGIYVASTATDPTTWSRSTDANEDSEVNSGMFVFVEEGDTNSNRGFTLTTSDPITLGSTSLNFTQFSGAGQINAGDGISKSGDTLSIDASVLTGSFLGSTSNNLDVQIASGLEDNSSNSIRVQGDEIADGFLSEGSNPHQISLNTASGLEGDGSNNLRVRGDSIADGFLSEGGQPHQISVNIGAGVESDGANNIRVSGNQVAGNFLSEGSSPQQVSVNLGSGLSDDGSNNIELTNDTISITGGDGITGSSISLGGSGTISVDPSDFAGLSLGSSGSPANLDVQIGDGIRRDGSDNIAVDAADLTGNFIGSSSDNLSVNIGNGLEGDGSNNIRINPQDIVGNGLEEANATTLGIATDGIGSNELDQSVSYSFTASQTIQISQPGSGASNIISLTNTNSSDRLEFTVRSDGSFGFRTNDNSAGTSRDIFTVDPGDGDVTMQSANIVPSTAGNLSIGTTNDYFNEMHATKFITHSPEPRSPAEAWYSLSSYTGGSMEMEEMLADVIEALKNERYKRTELEKRVEYLEQQI